LSRVLFKQEAGIGDIFFLQKAVGKYLEKGYEVVFPIIPSLLFLNDYIEHPGYDFKFVSIADDFPGKRLYGMNQIRKTQEVEYIPFWCANTVIFRDKKVLPAKYKLIGETYEDWADFFQFKRNHEKENSLFDHLGLSDEKYDLINRNYGTPPDSLIKKEVVSDTNNKVVDMSLIDGYNVFDWIKVFANAENIYTIDTCVLYIFEKIFKDREINVWGRYQHTKDEYDNILSKNKYNWR